VKAGVAERFMADITVGTPVIIGFDAFPEMNIETSVSFISKSIQPDNRTFAIEINLSNPSGRLAPEMIANLRLLRRSYTDKIVVPIDAMIESELGRHVFIAQDNKAVRKDVKILAVQEDSALVEGLNLNQNLIVVGQRELSAGDLIDIVD
jgi:multidrug efflux pump subunit AcrA (membrane-fusion protein)